jgi:hypothetical protein
VALYLLPLSHPVSLQLADWAEPFDDPVDLRWMRFTAQVQNLYSADSADYAYVSWDLCNITGGTVDPSWTQTDFEQATIQLQNICVAWSGHMSPAGRFTQMVVHEMAFNPLSESKPFPPSGPPVYQAAMNVTGTSGTAIAPQIACSVTEAHSRRKNWGRFYLPFVGSDQFDAAGRFLTSEIAALAVAVQTNYETLMGLELFPVVPYTSVEGQPNRGLFTVAEIRVDNVPDVIRRRRFATATARQILPV